MWLTLTSSSTNQKEVHKLISPSSLNHYYKTPHCTLQVWTHSFESISPLWHSLSGKSIKLFFSTSPKALPLRFNLVSVYRGQIWHRVFSKPCEINVNPAAKRCTLLTEGFSQEEKKGNVSVTAQWHHNASQIDFFGFPRDGNRCLIKFSEPSLNRVVSGFVERTTAARFSVLWALRWEHYKRVQDSSK